MEKNTIFAAKEIFKTIKIDFEAGGWLSKIGVTPYYIYIGMYYRCITSLLMLFSSD